MALSLSDKYLRDDGSAFMTGVQALVRLPLEQHRADQRAGMKTATFVSGYPGSPLGGYDLELGRARPALEAHDVVFTPGLNEELAATAVMGSQLAESVGLDGHDGVVGIWYGKGPGLDRATDAMRHANLAGTSASGGAIALVGDDPTAKSSTIPFSSEAALIGLAMPVLTPGNVQEALDLGRYAIAMSRFAGVWVGVKIATSVADGSATVELDRDRIEIDYPPLEERGAFGHVPTGRLVAPTSLELERSLYEVRLDLAREFAVANRLNEVVTAHEGDRIGIAAAGKSWFDVQQALRGLGIADDELRRLGIRLMKIGCLHPLDTALIRGFATGLREIVVIEDKLPLLERTFRDALYGAADQPVITGKRDPQGRELLKSTGEVDADAIADAIASRIEQFQDAADLLARAVRRGHNDVAVASVATAASGASTPIALSTRPSEPAPKRAPYFCSGCPHNVSTRMHEDDLVGAGIGCSGMVMLMPTARVGTLTGVTQMGGEGAQWIGMAPFTSKKHMFQNLGDGTFFHSGSLAIRAAVASGVDLTYKLLVNGTVAMTGGQDPVGGIGIPEMCRLLALEGVRKIIITTEDTDKFRHADLGDIVTVMHRGRLDEAQRTLAETSGVTVLLHDQQCAAEARRERKRGLAKEPPFRIFINERICEGCGDCGDQANCLSLVPVSTELGRKTQINQASCNKDYTCLKGDCPSFIEVVPGGKTPRRAVDQIALGELDEPDLPLAGDGFVVRIAGMGGTGVVTAAQVLGTAGLADGLEVRGLDQTGMAQKGGPVVSDLKFSSAPVQGSNRAATGEVDVYLGADLLVAADAGQLRSTSAGRTVAVVSTAVVPTGEMVTDPTVEYPDPGGLRRRIDDATTPARNLFFDAGAISATLFGGEQYANLVLIGAAYQAGLIPTTVTSIEQAIELNGVAVDANVQAFRRGRQSVASPDALLDAMQRASGSTPADAAVSDEAAKLIDRIGANPASDLHGVISFRVADLIDYQDERYARRYVDLLQRVRTSEQAMGDTDRLTLAVARYFYKLMAYKDEYEVARLALLPEVQQTIRTTFGARSKASVLLHPPLLRSMGLDHKIRLGRWFRPALAMLRGARRVRGSWLDPFGRAALRRIERQLIDQYEETIASVLARLSPSKLDLAVQIAELPDLVRGYEHIKLRNVEIYRQRLADLLAQFDAPAVVAAP